MSHVWVQIDTAITAMGSLEVLVLNAGGWVVKVVNLQVTGA
jgi:hypothetical protein